MSGLDADGSGRVIMGLLAMAKVSLESETET
jgi:hypothetical protein